MYTKTGSATKAVDFDTDELRKEIKEMNRKTGIEYGSATSASSPNGSAADAYNSNLQNAVESEMLRGGNSGGAASSPSMDERRMDALFNSSSRSASEMDRSVIKERRKEFYTPTSVEPKGPINQAREEKIQKFIEENASFRSSVPVWRKYEYWKLRADYYPHIKESDKMDNFFLRGITCHPRLSEYPMCKDVIKDYFTCRDNNSIFLTLFNVCAPLKEQMSACINVVFVRNHERGDKKMNARRNEMFESAREKKLNGMLHAAETSIKSRNNFDD